MTALWNLLNSPLAVAVLAAAVLWWLNWLYSRRPSWRKWEGTIIAAVKAAEKAVPDDHANTSVRRLDEAMRYVLRVYEDVCQRRPTAAEAAELREGVQIVHADLDARGTLHAASEPNAGP